MQQRLPDGLKRGIINTEKTKFIRKILKNYELNTVCESARCPNKAECYAKNTATFMILGKNCTRNCGFCCVQNNMPEPVNLEEPYNVAKAVKELGLKYAVITSVTRDDLPDGGAKHFAETITAIKKIVPKVDIEVLTPDFLGKKECIDTVISAKPTVFNHNVETVKRLYPIARPQADYERSLNFIKYIKEAAPEIYTKSGFMVGSGETFEEIIELLFDLKNHGCDIVTAGQYLQPTKKHLTVRKYYTLEEFEDIKNEALRIGIKHVVSGPLVRSSYDAASVLYRYTDSKK